MHTALRPIVIGLLAAAAAISTASTTSAAAGQPPPAGIPAAPASPSTPASPSAAGALPAPAASRTVTVATGERVLVGARHGRRTYAVLPGRPDGAGAVAGVRTLRLGDRDFVVPVVALPYLGRTLDPSLFEVSALARSRTPDRLPVEVAHTGRLRPLPGMTVTSDVGGVARGYLTATSAHRLGAALAQQWRAQRSPQRQFLRDAQPDLFAGITRVSAPAAAPAGRAAMAPQQRSVEEHTLTVRAIGPDGAPMQGGMGLLVNVDDSSRYTGFVWLDQGAAEVTVPAGTYGAVFDWVGQSPSGEPMVRTIPVAQLTVSGPGQVLTVDARRATVRPSVRTPRPVTAGQAAFTYYRGDALGTGGISSSQTVELGGDYAIRQTAAPTVGDQSFSTVYHLEQSRPSPEYVYDLSFRADRVVSNQQRTVSASQLGTVRARYDTDPAVRATLFGRYPVVAAPAPFFALHPLTVPAQRTEYVHGQGNPVWGEVELGDTLADDPAQLDGFASYPPRSRQDRTWRRGPLGAGIPTIPADSPSPLCRACRGAGALWLSLAPFTDSEPDHAGSLRPSPDRSPDRTPVAHLRLTADGEVQVDADDTWSALVAAPAGPTTYQAVLDVDRHWTASTRSTRSRTVLTFTSAADAGPPAPQGLTCAPPAASSCQVLPVLQARAELPTSGTGTLPTGTSTIDVLAQRVQGAAPAEVTAATLQTRAAGAEWVEHPLTALGGGRFRAQVLLPEHQGGRAFDLRVRAKDAGGSSYEQTVVRAFTLERAAR